MKIKRFELFEKNDISIFKSEIVKKYILLLLGRIRHLYYDYDEIRSVLGESDSYEYGYPVSVNILNSNGRSFINYKVASVSKDSIEMNILWTCWSDDDKIEANKLTEILLTVLLHDVGEEEVDKPLAMEMLNSMGHMDICFIPKKIQRVDYNFYNKIMNQSKFDL